MTLLASAIAAGAASGVEPAQAAKPVVITHAAFAKLLTTGRNASEKANVNFGEVLGITAPGSGEVLRIHTAYNAAKRIQGSVIDEDVGLLDPNAAAKNAISVASLVIGSTSYLRSTAAGSKWTKQVLPAGAVTSVGPTLANDLLTLLAPTGITKQSTSKGLTTYRLALSTNQLAVLRTFEPNASTVIKALGAARTGLLSGERISLPDILITLDRSDRVVGIEGGGDILETRADAAAHKSPYPSKGILGVILIKVTYAYGGSLQITAPPANQVINGKKPTL